MFYLGLRLHHYVDDCEICNLEFVGMKLLIKIRIKKHKCLHPFSSLLIADEVNA